MKHVQNIRLKMQKSCRKNKNHGKHVAYVYLIKIDNQITLKINNEFQFLKLFIGGGAHIKFMQLPFES